MLRKELNGYPGLRAVVQDLSQSGFTAQRGFPVESSVRGPDWGELTKHSERIRGELAQSGLVVDLDTDYQLGMPELRIVPDRARGGPRRERRGDRDDAEHADRRRAHRQVQRQRAPHRRRAAMLRAGPVRLRPILMTSIATLMAAVPSALALGPGAEIRAPMAAAIIRRTARLDGAQPPRRAGVLRARRRRAGPRRAAPDAARRAKRARQHGAPGHAAAIAAPSLHRRRYRRGGPMEIV
ncbi:MULTISPECIES: efflux RND transporter permease subunit [Sorangium]|uniref:Uncharacterized protein n=1 Tax=Sorangium cellulosum TaxID=56 RepID=A0A4P2QGK8_SORCE|nr:MULTISPECIES: efflux RND transporter permease subunit [Sorangium]AUX29004.1 uncharacterized protein SOCE836_010890 [Sorangium cellulosum]